MQISPLKPAPEIVIGHVNKGKPIEWDLGVSLGWMPLSYVFLDKSPKPSFLHLSVEGIIAITF